jgi:hypothetical protein
VTELHAELGGRVVHAPGAKLGRHHGGWLGLAMGLLGMSMKLLGWLLVVLEGRGVRGDVCRRVCGVLAGLGGGGEALISLGRAGRRGGLGNVCWMRRDWMAKWRRGGHGVTRDVTLWYYSRVLEGYT